MSRVVGDIAVEVSADITGLQRGLSRGGQAVSDFGTKAEKMAANLAAVTKGVGAVAAAATAAVAVLANVTRGIAETGDAAKRAGVDFEDFQRLSFVAKQNRIEVDALTDGIKEMQLRVDEFVTTGAGSASEALNRLGFNARDLEDRLRDPSELFLEITKRLEDLDAAAQIRVTDEVFGGTAGERFVELLSQGEGAIRETMNRADDLGLVLGRDVLESAEEVDRKFSEIQERISTMAKRGVVELAEAINDAFTVDVDEFFGGNADRARAILGDENYQRLKEAPDLVEDYGSALSALGGVIDNVEAKSNEFATTIYRFAEQFRSFGYDNVANELSNVAVELGVLVMKAEEGEVSAIEFNGALEDLIARAQQAYSEISAIDQAEFSSVLAGINSLSGALEGAIARAAELRATLPAGDTGEIAYGPQNGRGRIQGRRRPTDNAPDSSPRPQLPSIDADFGAPVSSGGGGGGGGGAALLPSRDDFEAFAQAFATEAEKLEIWRSEQLEKLTEFREAKLATEEEFNELEAAIQKEHGDRLADLEGQQRAERLRAIAGAFGDMSSLMQTENEKLFKIGKAAAIAEATVKGWEAAVKAWDGGLEVSGGNLGVAAAFAAASLAKTGAMISNIASQQIGGGSSGSSSSASATTAATETQTQTVSEIRFMGSLGAEGSALVDLINSEYERGNYVRAVVG